MSKILASLFAGLFAATMLVASPAVHAAKNQNTTTKTAKAKGDKKSGQGKKQHKKNGKKQPKSGKTAKK